MSIMSTLTSVERRILNEALENADRQRLNSLSLSALKDQTEQLPLLDTTAAKRIRSKGCNTMERVAQHERRERELWMAVERSLELPFVYRTDASKELALSMLCHISQFSDLSKRDLEVLCTYMRIVHIEDGTVFIGKQPQKVDCDEAEEDFVGLSPTFRKDDPFGHANQPTNEGGSGFEGGLRRRSSPTWKHRQECTEGSPSRKVKRGVTSSCVYVLLRGSVLLRLPSLKCSVDTVVESYEVFALPTTLSALPGDAFYQACADCTLLCFACNKEFLLDGVIKRLDRNLVKEQADFLQKHLRVKIFTHWTRQQYERCARALVPLRVSWRQMVVEQSVNSDAMYFIKEGQCVVVRNVPLLRGQHHCATQRSGNLPSFIATPPRMRKSSVKINSCHAAAPLSTTRCSQPRLSTLGSTKLVELATLREGEFFGELGLLSHRVDWKPDVDKVRSGAYWRESLTQAKNTPVDYAALDGNPPWRKTQCVDSNDLPSERRRSSSSGSQTAQTTDNKIWMFPEPTMKRQASVYTKCPCVLYMLPYDCCP
ncbi:unnamed protein product [Trypanosoma congolense IL3000]|uniref:WGS project CAEQ00000000 data, annotated contig 1073 n=1 Tax=Trypanosoma congolense (strain IL3000) TaxID=1068625 RepID=F9W3L6_TRYCI|nr:unnamed protein product [Trypanosoma congolense IL3000]